MAEFPGLTVTSTGASMVSESLASGNPLIITTVKFGDGSLASGDSIDTFTAMKNPLLTAALVSYTNKGSGEVVVRFTVSNTSLDSGFFARECGVFAKVGTSGTEKLYAYMNAGNLCDYIPSKDTPIDEQIFDLYIVVGKAANVIVNLNQTAYVTVCDMQDHDASTSAHAELMAAHNSDATAHSALMKAHNSDTTAHSALLHLAQRSHTYAVGDIAYSASLPSWARLECVTAGTTAATEPAGFADVSTGGVLLADGSVLWIVDDIRDMTPVGAVTARLYLPAGYVKANGATVQRADYPRLVAMADKYSLWTSDTAANLGMFGVGDSKTTMTLPNWTGRMAQYADTAGGTVAAGLPNITFITSVYNGYPGAFGYANGETLSTISSSAAASKQNSIYGNSTTVQPPAINVMAVMRY